MRRVDARLDITTDGWNTHISIPVSAEYERLTAVLKALDLIEVDAMLSCNCGAYEYGGCETCQQSENTVSWAEVNKAAWKATL